MIIKAYENTSIQLHEHINLQAYKYIVIHVWAHVDTKKGLISLMKESHLIDKWAFKNESVQAFEHESI